VAEGDENVDQLASLEQLGSDFVQGYLFGRPLPPSEILVAPRRPPMVRQAGSPQTRAAAAQRSGGPS